MKIRVCVPTLKRVGEVSTLGLCPCAALYVSPDEAAAYRAAYPKTEIVECAAGVQGNIARVRNHIMDREFANGADVVLMLDDDIKGMEYWRENRRVKMPPQDFLPFIEKYSRVCEEWGFKMWGVNCVTDKLNYLEQTPFRTKVFCGGPFQCHLAGGGLRYDERIPLKEDYDMMIQQCNKWRGVLNVARFHVWVLQHKNTGGCALYRNFQREREQLDLLVKKWGGAIVQVDNKPRGRQHKVNKLDINPVIKIPIKGV